MASRTYSLFALTLLWLTLWAAAPSAATAAEKTRVEDESPSATMPEDQKTKSYLRRAETAVKEKDWNEALNLLDRIVRETGDALVLIDRNTLEQLNIEADTVQFHWWTYISTRELVSRMMADMPAEALALKQVTAEPQAQNLLKSAIETGESELLLTLIENFPQTKVADNALYVLGEWNLVKEDYATAVSCYRQILTQYPDSDLDMGAIRWRLVQVLEAAGDAKDAAAELATLVKADSLPLVAGEPLTEPAKAWLAKLQAEAQAGGVVGAVSSSAATMMGSETHTNFVKDVPPMGDKMLTMEFDVAFVDDVYKTKIADREAAANIYPVVRDDTVFLTDGDRIRAYNLINPDPKAPYWAQPSAEDNRALPTNKLEHCRTLTVSDTSVFAVMGATSDVKVQFDWQSGNQFQLERTYINGYERPQGNPVMYGRIKWSTFKRDDMVNSEADKQFLENLHIPAAPVYVDGMLYCAGITLDQEKSYFALAINADTGRLRWRRQLCTGSLLAGTNRTIDVGSQVAVAAGRVYVLTPMGTLACIEAISGSVKWETAWQQTLEMQKLNQWNQQSRFPEDVPYPQPPIVFKDRVMILPQDCNWLIAFDTNTGAPKWIRDRHELKADLHYLYGIATTETTVRRKGVKTVEQVGMLIAAGRKVLAYNISNGKAIWETDLSEYQRAVGIGVVSENYVLVPTRTHLVPVAVHDGKIPSDTDPKAGWHRYKWSEPNLEAGHVLVNNGVIITASPNAFSVYYIKTQRQQQLLDTMKAQGESPALWMQIADLDDRTHEFDKALENMAKARSLAEAWAALPEADPKSADGKATLQEATRRIGVLNFKAGLQSLAKLQADEDKAAAGDGAGLLEAEEKFRLANAALVRFDTALASLRKLNPPAREDLAHAIWGRARALEVLVAADHKATPAMLAFQELISDYGDIRYTFDNDGKTESEAYPYAREKIYSLIARFGRDSYQPIEDQVLKVFNAEAGKPAADRDLPRLKKLLVDYPNAKTSGDILLLVADLTATQEGPLKAVHYLHVFMVSNGDNPKAPQVQFNLYQLYHEVKMFNAAKSMVMELKRRYSDRQILVNGRETAVATLVEKLLALPELQPLPSIAQRKILTPTPVEAWPLSLPRQGQIYALEADGEPPPGCEKFIYVHDMRDIYCIDGATGARRFAHKVLTLQRPMQVSFAGNNLVSISGAATVSGENAAGAGQAWEYEFKIKGESRVAQMLIGSDTLALVIDGRNLSMAGLEPTSGRELWTRTDIKGRLGQMPPTISDGRLVILTIDDKEATCHVLDAQTGENLAPPYKLESEGIQQAALGGTALIVQDQKNNLIALELFSGKKLWETPLNGKIQVLPNQWQAQARPMLFTTDKQVVAVRDGAIHILNLIDGKPVVATEPHCIDLKARVMSVVAEGDQLLVSLIDQKNAGTSELAAFALATGELQWKTPASNQIMLSPQHITRDHVINGANDFQNGNTFSLNMIDRKTGKIVYTNKMHNTFPRCIASCNGAFLFADHLRARGMVCVDPAEIKQRLIAIAKEFDAKPRSLEVRMKYCDALALTNQHEKALGLITDAFAQKLVDDQDWTTYASKLDALRRKVLETRRVPFLVQKTAKPPKLDGDLSDWKDATWHDFKDLRYIYFDTLDRNLAKSSWQSPDDLACRTAMKWDKDNLYICWEVTDEIHEQTKSGQSIWDGDSVQFALDPTLDGGTSWRQGDTEDSLAIDSTNGQSMSCIDYSPTQRLPEFKGLRDEKAKKTYYEMSIPLSDVGLEPKDGAKFGYTFIVNDRDDAKGNLNKGLAPSPGIWNPKTPDIYARAYFGKEGQTELTAAQKAEVAPPAAPEVDAGFAIE